MKTDFRLISLFLGLVFIYLSLAGPANAQVGIADGFRLAPGRVQLEMQPGQERTIVLNVQYGASQIDSAPVRLTAYINDWNTTETGEVVFHKAGSLKRSAASWLIYSPTEALVHPGRQHSIRVTISVPMDAAPGDHLAAVLIEPRESSIKKNTNGPQLRISFRLAALFYINVPQATRKGSLENLNAGVFEDTVRVVPTIKNEGNSSIRPTYSLRVISESNETLYERKLIGSPSVLAQSIQSRPIDLETGLPPGKYKVFYKVDFNDGGEIVEGTTSFTVTERPAVNIARGKN